MDLIPNLSLSSITYSSIRPFLLGHVIVQSRKISSTVPLPNGNRLPTADFFCRMHLKKPSFHRMDFSPSWSPKSDFLPKFGVNNIKYQGVAKQMAMQSHKSSNINITLATNEDTTSTSTPVSLSPTPAPAAPSSAPPSGPITRARAREFNFIMMLKNEDPKD
jgi:hypothetical protein